MRKSLQTLRVGLALISMDIPVTGSVIMKELGMKSGTFYPILKDMYASGWISVHRQKTDGWDSSKEVSVTELGRAEIEHMLISSFYRYRKELTAVLDEHDRQSWGKWMYVGDEVTECPVDPSSFIQVFLSDSTAYYRGTVLEDAAGKFDWGLRGTGRISRYRVLKEWV